METSFFCRLGSYYDVLRSKPMHALGMDLGTRTYLDIMIVMRWCIFASCMNNGLQKDPEIVELELSEQVCCGPSLVQLVYIILIYGECFYKEKDRLCICFLSEVPVFRLSYKIFL